MISSQNDHVSQHPGSLTSKFAAIRTSRTKNVSQHPDSRGAASCLFVEQDADAVKSIRKNIESLDARTRTTVQQASVMSLGPAKAPHDLILLDPPYDTGAGHVAIDRLTRLGWIGPATWVALETGAREERELRGLEVVADRKMGKAKVSLLRLAQ